MAFGDEDLMELRAQLIGAGQDPRGALVAGAEDMTQEPSRPLSGERAQVAHRPVVGPGDPPGGAAASRGQPQPFGKPHERDEFLAMLGHELRNPLAPLRSAVQLLLDHASAQDPAYLQQARAVLARQVEHLWRLADVLLGGNAPEAVGTEATAVMALIERMVELHGGRFTAHAGAPGSDTELRVWLPAVPPEALPTRGSPPVEPEARPRRVLVVDDNEDAAEMLALVLRKRGYTVMLAFDGEEALAMAHTHHPDVVLLDIGLPGIDGYEVARRLRATPMPERPVLVAVTGYGQPADRMRSREAGFDHHLVKPVAMEKLLPLLVS